VLLGSVGAMLRVLRPDDEAPEHLHLHGLLLYHAFHFHEAGEPLFVMEAALLRRLADVPLEGAWDATPSGPAGYVQVPLHLVWTAGAEGEPPESVDGFYWAAPSRGGDVSLLLAAGMRSDRPGLSVIPVPPLTRRDLARREAETSVDLRSSLPGAELGGLLQI